MKKTLMLVAAFALTSSVSLALDKEFIANHIRKALNEPPQTEVTLGDPEPSEFKDLNKVDMTIKSRRGTQAQPIFVSKDEKKYIFGVVFDLTTDPDKERAEKISLKDVNYKGWNKAPVTIVEYSDFQCGYCKKAHQALGQELYKNYTKKQVRLVFKHFPLSRHKWAEAGAAAADCAGQQSNDKFWAMTDKIFDNALGITPENVKEKTSGFAKDIGLNRREFKTCVESDAVKKRIEKQKQEGISVGVGSTPTFFVNGRMLRGLPPFAQVKVLIDEKLAEK